MPLVLVDLTGVSGIATSLPFTVIVTEGTTGGVSFFFFLLNPSPLRSKSSVDSFPSATRKIACFLSRWSTNRDTSMVYWVVSCLALAGITTSPILVPFHVSLSQGPSSHTFTLNESVVFGVRNRLNVVLFPFLVPLNAFRPWVFFLSPPKPKYLYPMIWPF